MEDEPEMPAPRLDEVAEAIAAAFPKLSPEEQRISIAIYRRLAQGRPAGIADIASEARVGASQVEAAIRGWRGRIHLDDGGAVIGYSGLTLSKTRHRLRLNGHDHRLHTWCAWDTLFIPMLLGSEAEVESECPVSREQIALRVTRRGADAVSHPGAVISFVTPQQGKIEQDVIRNFCHFVHFFASAAEGGRWTAEHPETFLLSLADAWELGRRKNALLYRDTLEPAAT
jgi:alkylmercury lyase